MWEIDDDGDAQSIYTGELLCVVPTFTVKLFQVRNKRLVDFTLKHFYTEAEAREYIRAYVATQNWENSNHADKTFGHAMG